jgi:hypothetical protein
VRQYQSNSERFFEMGAATPIPLVILPQRAAVIKIRAGREYCGGNITGHLGTGHGETGGMRFSTSGGAQTADHKKLNFGG